MLFHVAICDDMPVDILMLENKIKESSMGKVLDLKYNRFIKGEDLLKAVRSGKKYDLVILDISLKGLNGEEIAIKLRDTGYDSLLVFCTAGNGPSVNSFKSGPYRFLLKSFTGKEIISELDGIFKELVDNKQVIAKVGQSKLKNPQIKPTFIKHRRSITMNSKAKKGLFTIFILLLVVIQPCYCTEAATEKAKPIISVSFFCNDDFDNSQVTLVSMSILSANFFPGMKRQMFASVLFPTAETISWSSSNLDVAIVSDSGLVTAVSPGIALITASMGGSSSSCEVVIEDPKRFKNITTKQMTDSQMEIIKEYDKRGILKKQTMIKEYSDTVVTYRYDNNGYLKSINWIYNSLGRDDVYCEFPDPASYKVYYYDNLAVRKTTSIDSEYGETTKWIYEYDEAGRTIKKKVYGTLEGEPTHLLVSKKYHYDSNGLLKKEVITDYDSFGEKNMISKKKYVYDDHANLIKVKTK